VTLQKTVGSDCLSAVGIGQLLTVYYDKTLLTLPPLPHTHCTFKDVITYAISLLYKLMLRENGLYYGTPITLSTTEKPELLPS
jgi:hypothetical protein